METKDWKWFRVGGLFKLEPSKGTTTTEMVEGSDIIYIAAKKDMNGKDGLFALNGNEKYISKGNCIVFIQIGAGSAGYTTYQSFDFIGMSGKTICGYNSHLNQYVGCFLMSILDMERMRYNFGRSWTGDRLENTFIKLPAILNSKNEYEPDWKWIENYVKETLIPKLPLKAKNVWENNYDTKPVSSNKLKLKTNEWQFFRYDDIFRICKGKRLTKADMFAGNIPYIGAIDSNNGISAYISNDENLHSANTITVSYNGSIAEAYYQPKPFWATDDVNVLYPKFELNVYIALFLTTIINEEKYRFNYGRKWDKELMKKSIIKLPAILNANGEYEPDWQWMEDYIKSLPYSSCL